MSPYLIVGNAIVIGIFQIDVLRSDLCLDKQEGSKENAQNNRQAFHPKINLSRSSLPIFIEGQGKKMFKSLHPNPKKIFPDRFVEKKFGDWSEVPPDSE